MLTLRSKYWKFFSIRRDDISKAECKLCGLAISRGSTSVKSMTTSNMQAHLKRKHPIEYSKELLVKQEQKTLVQEKGNLCKDNNLSSSKNREAFDHLPQTEPDCSSSQVPEKYKICHDNHLKHVFESLAGDESFMDVSLTAEGKIIKAHKSVLSAVSPYFQRVLKENPCQHPVIIMPRDICFEDLYNVIHYIYKGEITVNVEDLSRLLKTAEILHITGLSTSDSEREESKLKKNVDLSDVNVFKKPSSNLSKKSRKRQYSPPQQVTEDTSFSVEERINPFESLNTDMDLIKEEIQIDIENENRNEMEFHNEIVSSNTSTIFRKRLTPDPLDLSDSVGKCEESEPSSSENEESKPLLRRTYDPNICPYCTENYEPAIALRNHLKLKHPSKPSLVCDCGRAFLRNSWLILHKKKCKLIKESSELF